MTDFLTTIQNLANAAKCLDKPVAIKAFLDIACEGDTTLRAAVERQLLSLETEDETTVIPVSFRTKVYDYFTQNNGIQVAYCVAATLLGSATIVSVPLFGLYKGLFNPDPIVSNTDPQEIIEIVDKELASGLSTRPKTIISTEPEATEDSYTYTETGGRDPVSDNLNELNIIFADSQPTGIASNFNVETQFGMPDSLILPVDANDSDDDPIVTDPPDTPPPGGGVTGFPTGTPTGGGPPPPLSSTSNTIYLHHLAFKTPGPDNPDDPDDPDDPDPPDDEVVPKVSAVIILYESLAASLEALGAHHPVTLDTMRTIGSLLHSQDKFVEAEPLYRDTLAGNLQVFGEDHPNTLIALRDLGHTLMMLGEFEEAEIYLRSAVQGMRRILGNEHPDTLSSISSFGELLIQMGNFTEARQYLVEVLESRRLLLGYNHIDTIAAVDHMGSLYYFQSKYGKAEQYYRKALSGRRRTLGNTHPDTLQSIQNMSDLMRKVGRLDEALAYQSEFCQIYAQQETQSVALLLSGMIHEGMLLLEMGHREEATAILTESVDTYIRVADTNPQLDTNSARVLIQILMLQRKFAEAEILLVNIVSQLMGDESSTAEMKQIATQQLVDLYIAWHQSEPDQGYDIIAQELRDSLHQQ